MRNVEMMKIGQIAMMKKKKWGCREVGKINKEMWVENTLRWPKAPVQNLVSRWPSMAPTN